MNKLIIALCIIMAGCSASKDNFKVESTPYNWMVYRSTFAHQYQYAEMIKIQDTFGWYDGEVKVKDSDLRKLAEKILNITILEDVNFNFVDFTNYLGKNGWEIKDGAVIPDETSPAQIWIFEKVY